MHCIKDGREIVICMRLVGEMSVGMTAIIEQNMYFRIAQKWNYWQFPLRNLLISRG